jgi:hypothetical protein
MPSFCLKDSHTSFQTTAKVALCSSLHKAISLYLRASELISLRKRSSFLTVTTSCEDIFRSQHQSTDFIPPSSSTCTVRPAVVMDAIKGTISSITGSGSTQTQDSSDRDLKPTPPETGLQSRGQTEHSGSGSFLGEMKDMVNSAIGAGGTKEEKEPAVEKCMLKHSVER